MNIYNKINEIKYSGSKKKSAKTLNKFQNFIKKKLWTSIKV